ncbi:plasmolipin-like [Pieris napi]|uniref:plasmolipin-like n=1 Tax=Pieris napi TaxID=78633 RepID=UPI001FB95405|nr:plasmolipin-like [Pieris napi]XP_047507397.1 plasmolipin-like [Pieris napi]XP_047507398.1 plasmolipin-like [Pieris napi]
MFDHFVQNPGPAPPPSPPKKELKFDKNYLKTTPGILQLVEVVCNFIGFICIKVSWSWISAIFYNILYWIGNILTVFLFLMYLFHFVEKYDNIPWQKIQFFYCVAMSLAYIGTSIFATTIGESVGYAVGFFGFCAIVAYGIDAYLNYKGWKRGLPAQ